MSKSKASSSNASNTGTKETAVDHAAKLGKGRRHLIVHKFKQSVHLIIALLYSMPDGEAKSGRTGSVVYQRNGRRRNFVVPALVQNSFTQGVRAAFSALSSAFKALTADQINAWNATEGFFKSDRFGKQVAVKGKSLYVALNQNLINVGVTPISDPPLAGAVPAIDNLTVTAAAGAGTVSLVFSPSPTDADTIHLVFATPSLSPGVRKPSKSKYRLISTIAGAATTPAAVGTAYVAKFGAMTAGANLFVKLIPINSVTGQAGAPIVASDIIAA